jgi:hypothetical protein
MFNEPGFVALPVLYVLTPNTPSFVLLDPNSFSWAMILMSVNRFLIHIRSSEKVAEYDDTYRLAMCPIGRGSADAASHFSISHDSDIELPSYGEK